MPRNGFFLIVSIHETDELVFVGILGVFRTLCQGGIVFCYSSIVGALDIGVLLASAFFVGSLRSVDPVFSACVEGLVFDAYHSQCEFFPCCLFRSQTLCETFQELLSGRAHGTLDLWCLITISGQGRIGYLLQHLGIGNCQRLKRRCKSKVLDCRNCSNQQQQCRYFFVLCHGSSLDNGRFCVVALIDLRGIRSRIAVAWAKTTIQKMVLMLVALT
mmetsp:Transcript_29274/g.79210  ORF Transcript_29274/g.79210 Transcript_29274/m.79210 type:complete len:216 (-) Transcript_29274:30-677(-)